MSNMESLPAQEFNPPFRVDPTGLALRETWQEHSQDAKYLKAVDDRLAVAETAGKSIVGNIVDVSDVA